MTGTSDGCTDTDHVSVHVNNKAEWDHVNKGHDTDCGSCNGSIIVDANYSATGKFTVRYTYNGQTFEEGPFTTPSDIMIGHLCAGTYTDITIVGVHTGCEDVWPHDITLGSEDCCNEEGGAIIIAGSGGGTETSICVDGTPDPIDVAVAGASGTNFAWVITDADLNILALPSSPPFDLDGAGEGVCLIWYLAFDEIQGAEVDANAGNLQGCFDLSNPITVTRTCCDDNGHPTECQTECQAYTLDFDASHTNWHQNSTSGSYTVGNQRFDINIEDDDNILELTKEGHLGLKIGYDPHDRHDEVVMTYTLSEVSSHVLFDIVDLDYKTSGLKRQEKVCVYGLLGDDDTQIMPTIQSLDGSVAISGNCATATTGSYYGHDESVLVEFTECIDQIVIVIGSGPDAPHNPDYSKIVIGKDYGFMTEVCPDACGTSQREDESFVADVSIFPNPVSESFVTLSIESELQGAANIVLIDALGRTINNLPIALNGSLTQYQLNVSDLSSGVYFVTVLTQEGRSKAQQLVVVRP